MFGLFNNKSSTGVNVIDKVWISKAAKLNACAEMFRLNPQCAFICWFEDSFNELNGLLGNESPVYLAEQVAISGIQGKMVMFAEHYPMTKTEEAVYKKLNLKEVPVLSGLDEPIFMQFGGERTIELMKKLGMNENEPLGHSMISKAIQSAQRKLADKVKVEKKATSQQQWFELNLS